MAGREPVGDGAQARTVGVAIHSGPLPDPMTLAGYGAIDPSFPDRIMTMAERNAEAERDQRGLAMRFTAASEREGRWMALGFSVVAIAVSCGLALAGHDAVAGIIGGTTVVGIVVAILKGRPPG
ncbi:putative membrane protein [Endobacter medicaginis]|jgi:uncharacterized membrane protein|uniref:Putative membrane protein n=1 Tax=Endobacter medicaginis TaxID=1181271 RepID=A0A839UYU4_9PROT|nr:DUF2335 domain-containing protein [Endobacter medicaginis]MBB3173523.1 putative membrane protein [Endobacter medicaginis]MCX5475388.1 DUF2335 domain-containing protein [Endobacter medicaginis]